MRAPCLAAARPGRIGRHLAAAGAARDRAPARDRCGGHQSVGAVDDALSASGARTAGRAVVSRNGRSSLRLTRPRSRRSERTPVRCGGGAGASQGRQSRGWSPAVSHVHAVSRGREGRAAQDRLQPVGHRRLAQGRTSRLPIFGGAQGQGRNVVVPGAGGIPAQSRGHSRRARACPSQA